MTTKIEPLEGQALSIPLNKLKKSPKNVRKATPTAQGLAELRASIATKGILQNLVVSPERDDEGAPTGFYFVTAGERRRLVQVARAKDKEIKKDHPLPCVINEKDDPVDISLAENVIREAMHPADQFEAFRTLAEERGLGVEDIAARYGVTIQTVRQRLRLGAIAPGLMAAYREEALTLDQLTAFAITEDHARQVAVWERLKGSYFQPFHVRRALTEDHVPASDRRALFVGQQAYLDAGGFILRDLFTEDGGGYFKDIPLLDQLTSEKLNELTIALQYEEGWKWAQCAVEFPHAHGYRRAYKKPVELSSEDQETLATAREAYDTLTTEFEGVEELPDDIDERFGELEATIERIEDKTRAFDPEDVARGGIIVALSHDGQPRIERGFQRTEDLLPGPHASEADGRVREEGAEFVPSPPNGASKDEDDEPERPVSEYLLRELTAHSTMAMRLTLGENPKWAYIALLHALVCQTFHYGNPTFIDIWPNSAFLNAFADGIGDTLMAQAVMSRHTFWAERVPGDPNKTWDFLEALDDDSRAALLAHCVAITVNAVRQVHAAQSGFASLFDRLSRSVGLDMADHWTPTVANYLGRVTKLHILTAVREGAGDAAAERLKDLKKQPMALAAEEILAESRWLPVILRTDHTGPTSEASATSETSQEGNDPENMPEAAE